VKYAVEVTILMLKVDVGAKNPLPVGIIRDFIRKFVVDEVESVARNKGFLKGTYSISFSEPITNFVNVKDMIQSELLNFIQTTQEISKSHPSVVYKHKRQECLIEKLHIEDDKVIMGGPIISRWEGEALEEAKQLLANRLDEKKYRLRNINDPKILLLHNKYSFADIETYKACISEMLSLKSFHTIFVAESNNEGKILYSQEPSWGNNS
jgi:hypothetical protein